MARIALLIKDDADKPVLLDALRNVSAIEEFEILKFEQPGRLAGIYSDVRQRGFERALVCGGDGTLHDAVTEALKFKSSERIPLGVLPLGTANDFARATAFGDLDLAHALHAAVTAPVEWVDVGCVNSTPFINIVTGGDFTRATTDLPKTAKAVFGKVAYFINALAKLAQNQAHHIEFVYEGKRKSLSCFGFAVANSAMAGGGLRLAPDAKINDGYLDVLIVPEQSVVDLTRIAKELLTENPNLAVHNVVTLRTRKLEVFVADEIQINADGEPIVGKYFEFGVLPRALQMVIPNAEVLDVSGNAFKAQAQPFIERDR